MALKYIWTDDNNIAVTEGELYRLSCDIRIDSSQIMSVIERIYPSVNGLVFEDFETVVFVDENSPVDTVINIKANYRPTATGTINAGVAVETVQLEDNVVFTLDNYSVEGPKCLTRYPDNQLNFIRWQSGQNLFLPLSSDFDQCGSGRQDIPNAYAEEYDRNLCRKYRPILINDEQLSFAVNRKIPSATAGLANLSIAVIDFRGNTVLTNKGSVSLTDADPNGDVTVYGNYTPDPLDALNNGFYRLVIYNTLTDQILFVSNELEFTNDSDYLYKSVYLDFRNSSRIYNYPYNDLPTFRNKVRVNLTRVDAQPEIELTQYQEASTGKVRNQKTQAKKILTLESYFFDDYAHDAMLALSLHDDILINNKVMEVKTAYQIETNVRSNTNKGNIEMYDQEYSTVNLAGN